MKILSIVLLVLAPAIGIADEHDSLTLPNAAAPQIKNAEATSVEGAAKPDTIDAAPLPVVQTEAGLPTNLQGPLPPKAGSHIAADDNNCIQCHGETDLWDEKSRQLFLSKDKLAKDVHWLKGVNCTDCHGGNYKAQEVRDAHSLEDGFRSKPEEIRKYCSYCHDSEALELVKGVHHKAGPKNERGQGTMLSCDKCHGNNPHQIFPVKDSMSPVFIDNQVKVCGACHEKDYDTYKLNAHGQGLYKMGLQVTASCADCHGSHGIYKPADQRSALYLSNVAGTCGKCHRFIAEYLQTSIHGSGKGLGNAANRLAPGGKNRQHPSCTSCHQGHSIQFVESEYFRKNQPSLCGNCHGQLSSRYAMSIHGELTELGYAPAARCSTCHGSHDILSINNPKSPVSPQNRLKTCSAPECHPHANSNFANFDPHVDHTDPNSNPFLYWTYKVLMTLMISVFSFFGVHSLFWFVRCLIDVMLNGRSPQMIPGEIAYERFTAFHRYGHTLLLISFLGLALTGIPLKYSEYGWARVLADFWGGFASTSIWHRVFAVGTFICFFAYLILLVVRYHQGRREGKKRLRLIFGPDSPVPNWRDVKDFFRMVRWFIGMGPKPTFERWAYWDKFDFWGAIADVVIIGSTGLILWFPNFFCLFLPGLGLNIAKLIHSTQALLATGFVFAVHFFNTHLRADKFPADMSVLTGLYGKHEFETERPEYMERLRLEGKLEKMHVSVPSKRYLLFVRLGGYLALLLGLGLLAGIVLAAMS
jgi:cytochrome b subunit of formate dehydrogenase